MFQLKAEISNHPRVVSQQVHLLSPFLLFIGRLYLIQLSLNMIVYDDDDDDGDDDDDDDDDDENDFFALHLQILFS